MPATPFPMITIRTKRIRASRTGYFGTSLEAIAHVISLRRAIRIGGDLASRGGRRGGPARKNATTAAAWRRTTFTVAISLGVDDAAPEP
jgi:hypothetical protein